jgi:hypothetical protein
MLSLARLRPLKAAVFKEIEAGRVSPNPPEPAYTPTETDLTLDRVLLEIPGTRRLVKGLRALIHPPLPAPPATITNSAYLSAMSEAFARDVTWRLSELLNIRAAG